MRSDEWDRILDNSLRSYTAEPRPGLENRVLESIRQIGSEHRPMFAAWVLVSAAVVCVVVVGIAIWLHRGAVPVEFARIPAVLPLAPPALAGLHPQPEAPRPRLVKHARMLPKRSQFPTPLPLTSEERALIGIAARAPDMLMDLGRNAGPLKIPDLEIQPLEID